VIEDYLYAVNQTYEIKLRQEGYLNLTHENIDTSFNCWFPVYSDGK